MAGDSSDEMLKITKRHDFTDKLLNQLQIMKDQEYLTDFLLKVDDKEVRCHKVVLAASSEYFHRLFNHKDTLEVSHGFVNFFPTLNFPALKLVVEYCYTGILECNMNNAKYVIEVIEHLQIPDLKTDLSELIVKHLTANNGIGWYFIAKLYGMATVKTRAREMMSVDFTNVVRSPEFLALDFDELVDYIIWQDMDHSTSLIAAARWIMHDCEQRGNKFRDILKTINISQCSASALKHIVTKYGPQLITNFDISQEFFSAAFSDASDWQEPGPWAGYSIIVLGGMRSDNVANRQSWRINLKTGESVEKSSLPREIRGLFVPAICSSPKGAVFAGGASEYENGTFRKRQTQCVIYQKAEDTWAILPELPSAVMLAGAVCMNAKVYVFGGKLAQKNRMNCLDMTSMTWNPCPNLLQGLVYPVVGRVGHSIYVIFSTHPYNELTAQGLTLQCFDSTTSSWSFKASIPEAVKETAGAATITIDHCLFVFGGLHKICLSYNTREDAWTILTPPLTQHHFGAALYLKGKIILTGGIKEGNVLSDVIESYDPETNAWTILPILFRFVIKFVLI